MERIDIDIEKLRKRKTTQDFQEFPSPYKINNLIKPDLSPILLKENHIGYKISGSYKKRKFLEPESPMKSPNFKTPVTLEKKNLFGTNPAPSHFRKLNFDEVSDNPNFLNWKASSDINANPQISKNSKFDVFLEKCKEEENEEEEKVYSENINVDIYNINNNSANVNMSNFYTEFIKNGKFDNEFKVLRTIKKDKFSIIYKVEEIKTKKKFCIKKIFKTSPKNDLNFLKQKVSDFTNNSSRYTNQFCVKILDFWIENEEFNQELADNNYSDRNLYILEKYYEYGDIFDYFEQLEKIKYEFSENFYWDTVFEMLIAVYYFNEMGYLHLDIKPSNYLVDENGYIKLGDFSLSQKINDLKKLDDLIEGDSRYISLEVFHFSNEKNLDTKCDVFSLGMTLLELIGKIELPYNGTLWHEFRSEDFKLTEKYFENCNLINYQDFYLIISDMISPLNKRLTLMEIIKKYDKLKERYGLLIKGEYRKSCCIPKLRLKEDGNLIFKTIPSVGKL